MSVLNGGFTPVKALSGETSFTTRRYQKDVSQGAASLIYVGDPVRLTTGGKVAKLLATDTSAAGPGVMGVVARVLVTEAGRPRVHGLPDQHPNVSLTADADWLDIYVDPTIVYSGKLNAAVTAGVIGLAYNVVAGTPVAAAGISGTKLDNSTGASSTLLPFKVVGVSNFSLDSSTSDASGRVEVIINKTPLATN